MNMQSSRHVSARQGALHLKLRVPEDTVFILWDNSTSKRMEVMTLTFLHYVLECMLVLKCISVILIESKLFGNLSYVLSSLASSHVQ